MTSIWNIEITLWTLLSIAYTCLQLYLVLEASMMPDSYVQLNLFKIPPPIKITL
jgi:hypothetical protein